MKRIYQLFWLLIVTVIAHDVCAQSGILQQDLDQLSRELSRMRAHVHVDYHLYAGHTSSKRIQEQKAEYYVWDKMYSMEMDDSRIIKNDKMLVSIDHEDKVILLNAVKSKFDKNWDELLTRIRIDSTLKEIGGNYTFLGEDSASGVRSWKINVSATQIDDDETGQPFSFIDISYGKDFRLHKVVLYYNQSFETIFEIAPDGVGLNERPRVEVLYRSYTPIGESELKHKILAEEVLSLNAKGSVLLKPQYKTYQVVNYLNLK